MGQKWAVPGLPQQGNDVGAAAGAMRVKGAGRLTHRQIGFSELFWVKSPPHGISKRMTTHHDD